MRAAFTVLGPGTPTYKTRRGAVTYPHPLPTQSKCPSSGGTSEGVLDESEGRYTSGNTRPGLSSGIGAANEGRKRGGKRKKRGRVSDKLGGTSPLFCTGAPGTIYLCQSRDGPPSDGFRGGVLGLLIFGCAKSPMCGDDLSAGKRGTEPPPKPLSRKTGLLTFAGRRGGGESGAPAFD